MVTNLTFGTSQMMFNERVLGAGQITDSLTNISNKLMFNQIYLGNADEVFRKENSEEILEIHKSCLKDLERNVLQAIKLINEDAVIDISSQFDFENRLIVTDILNNELVGTEVNSLAEYDFKEDQIYYIYKRQEQWVVLTAPMNSVIYQKPIMYTYKDFCRCWQTIPSVLTWIWSTQTNDEENHVTAIKVVKGKNEPGISKIEYASFGTETDLLLAMKKDLDPKSIVMNNLLYIDDIVAIASEFYPDIVYAEDELNSIPIPLTEYELDDIFEQDILSQYPRESFDTYLRLLNKAAMDKRVAEISLCIYRIGNNPSIFYCLREAIRNGKDVRVNVEMNATGEDINEFWLKELRNIGAHVTSYQRGFIKVHAKLTLVRFHDGRIITQVGTGNYHWKTTTRYSDLSYITANLDVGKTADRLFKYMSNEYDDIETMNVGDDFIITPINGRDRLQQLINDEGEKGSKGSIAIKCNSLEDAGIIDTLNSAAMNGCHICLNIRGVCLWNPGPMLDKNVSITSIVWDQLEHSRVYCFGIDYKNVYIGSLDLVKRKIDRRIETLLRVPDYNLARKLREYVMDCVFAHPNRQIMRNDNGIYYQKPKEVNICDGDTI